ncbi:MAG: redoxin domain-containing protein, partial [Bacteroides sp.]|nr:redoxin domain-containing protein [Bacteroides sp.]
MRHVKWIFVVLLISSLTSFVGKDKPTGGLNVGDIAPDFTIQTMSAEQSRLELSTMKGKYVLLSFWASYDAQSRMQNTSLSNALRSTARNDVEMVSISFDEYKS